MKLSGEQQERITKLYADHFVPLLFYAASVLRDRDAAEEAVQETFRIACARAERLLASPNPEGWLFLTLKNILRNRKRTFSRFLKVFSPLSLDDDLHVAAEPPDDLGIMIQSVLTADEYRLYRQVIVDGETIARAAQKNGISADTCKKRVQRIREKLRQFFEEDR